MPLQSPSGTGFFDSVRALASRLEQAGQTAAAAHLREGFASLNGLTDGWAMLLDAIGRAINECRDQPDLRRQLEDMEKQVYRTVHRRPMWPWTQFFRRRGTPFQ